MFWLTDMPRTVIHSSDCSSVKRPRLASYTYKASFAAQTGNDINIHLTEFKVDSISIFELTTTAKHASLGAQ